MITRAFFIALPILALTGCSHNTSSEPVVNAQTEQTGDINEVNPADQTNKQHPPAKPAHTVMNSNTQVQTSSANSNSQNLNNNVYTDPKRTQPVRRVFDSDTNPLKKDSRTTCTGTFIDEQFNLIQRVEIIVGSNDEETALSYKIEVDCMSSSVSIGVDVPLKIKSSAVSCLDVQKALSEVPVCSKFTSIGDRSTFDADLALWFLPGSGRPEKTCADVMPQLNQRIWSSSIEASNFRNLPNLYKIQLEFDTVIGFSKYYSMDNMNGVVCPTGFNTDVVASLSEEFHKLRNAVADALLGVPAFNV